MRCCRNLCLVLASAMAPVAAFAAADQPIGFEWNARLRHETVDDDAFAPDASATTLRLRAGLRAQFGSGISALLEGEGVAAAGAYNSGANGRAQLPPIIDPAGVEMNQAWLGWKGTSAGAIIGRQRLLLDNQRWVGNSGWRQNEQTFDAASFEWQARPSLVARYAWIDRVHRVNGDDALDPLARERDLDSHLFNLAWKHDAQLLASYAYLHQDRDVAAASTATYGLRWTGSRLHEGDGWSWTLEAARQREHADNPLSFAHAYWLIEPTFATGGLTYRAGWEHLGGDGAHSLQAPLGTLHAFNGWADRFLVTPVGGLEDFWLGTGGKFGRGPHAGKFSWNLAWHDYRADTGGDYGSEWNASLGFPVHGSLTGLIKFADYRSNGFGTNASKVWLQLEWIP